MEKEKTESLLNYYGFTAADQKKYPVVAGILRELTPERIEKEIEEVKKVELPAELQKWVREYWKVGGHRNEFIWKWLYVISQTITLLSVAQKYKKSLWEIKFLMIMFVVLMDDIADKYKNRRILNELLKIPFRHSELKLDKLKQKEKKYIDFTIKVWRCIKSIYEKYPRYGEFRDFIEFDIKQVLIAMEYAYLVNKNHNAINILEYKIFFSHNMQLIINVMFDLSCSTKFNSKEMGTVREIAIYAQQMARIGNWVSTWEREIEEEDFTSGVFANAIEHKLISLKDLKKDNKSELVKKINGSDIKKNFLKDWQNNYQKIKRLGKSIKTIDISDFLIFLEKVIFAHLSSKGYK